MMVNFMCQFGPRNAQTAGETLCLDVTLGVFLEEINTDIGRLTKDQPSSM